MCCGSGGAGASSCGAGEAGTSLLLTTRPGLGWRPPLGCVVLEAGTEATFLRTSILLRRAEAGSSARASSSARVRSEQL